MANNTELWLVYHQTSRTSKLATAQLIDLELQHPLTDLEDVLEHIFQQGFVDAKYRSMTWWEQHDGVSVKATHGVQELLKLGVGRSPETALRLVIADRPPALWFTYVFLRTPRAQAATQRVKLDAPNLKCERLAHITNYIFAKGYLPANYRSLVHWQGACGKQVDENAKVEDLLSWGEGVSEDKSLRLIIDAMSTALRGWHPGEVNIQRKLSFDSPMAMAWSWISADMAEEHRMFYTRHLPFVPVTTLDARGRPWGSILASKNGTPGFMRSPMETVLQIEAQTWEGDPWTDNLGNWLEGEKGKFLLAGIGIGFGTRRRNKFAGWMTDVRENGERGYSLSLEVNQAIGNCPKYINIRDLVPYPDTHPKVVYRKLHLDDNERLPEDIISFIKEADTVFLATSYTAKRENAARFPSHVGMNQRGGRAGFVRVKPSDGRTVVLPDYSGNRLLTSLGNIEATPLAGLTIPSFSTGTLLYLTGDATTLVGDDARSLMPRQNVLTTIRVTGYTLVRDALPVRQRPGSSPVRSPYSPPIKHLREEQAPGTRLIEGTELTVLMRKIELHSDSIATFTWDVDGPAVEIAPGQTVILGFADLFGTPAYQHMAPHAPASVNDDRVRTWTVSSAHSGSEGATSFELTMRVKPGGLVTGALFSIAHKLRAARPDILADARPLQLRATLLGVSGAFALPIVGPNFSYATPGALRFLWIAGGIGVTPFLSMLAALTQARRAADVELVLATHEPSVLIPLVLRAASSDAAVEGFRIRLDVFATRDVPVEKLLPVPPHVQLRLHAGRIPGAFWAESVDVKQKDVYVCGPHEFEETVLEGLRAVGLDTNTVKREAFEY